MRDKIVIGIPTYKRPSGLELLLNSLKNQKNDEYDLVILVVDNDYENCEGYNYINFLKKNGFPFTLDSFIEPKRGISSVRNKILSEALKVKNAYALIMLDDDEIVCAGWLENLLITQKKYNCDVVGGAVIPAFESPAPSWIEGVPLYYREIKPTGVVNIIENTGNTLILLSVLEKLNFPSFDEYFGLSGGEDKEFFTRLKSKGIKFGYCSDAIAEEFYPDSRVTKSWCLQRAYRIGSTDMNVFFKHYSRKKYFIELTKGVLIFVTYPFIYLRFIGEKKKQFNYKIKLFRAAGKISSFFGKKYYEYNVTHGK